MMLKPGENVVYKAKIHRFCYVIPSLLLAAGLLLIFTPEFSSDPQSRFHALAQDIKHVVGVIKGFIPEDVWYYLEAIQAFRTNYLGLLLTTIGGIQLLSAFGYRNFSRYWVTDKRVLSQTSIFRKKIQEIALERLENVRIHYGHIGKLINRGMVVMNDAGMQEIEIRHLSKPEKYRQAIITVSKQYRNRGSSTPAG